MSELVKVHRDPLLTAVAWDAVVSPGRVPDTLVQRLPYDLVERNVFRLDDDAAVTALERFAEQDASLHSARVTRIPNASATVDGLFHIDTRWLLLRVIYQPAMPATGWALLHSDAEGQWAGCGWPNDKSSTIPAAAARLAMRAALDTAM